MTVDVRSSRPSGRLLAVLPAGRVVAVWLMMALASTATADSPRQPVPEARAQHVQAQGARLARKLIRSLGEARRQSRPDMTRCVDGLLSRANSLRARVQLQVEAMRQAARRGDAAAEQRHAARLGILAGQLRRLERDALGCEPGQGPPTETRVEAVIPPGLDDEPLPLPDH